MASDRVNLALTAVFLIGAAFYLWRGASAAPLALHGFSETQYNQLADAFLHLHLWVAHVPDGILGHGNPYDPAQRPAFLFGFPDYSLYGHYLYITWGPAPVLVLLVPLHLLGFEPSGSLISAPFVIVGLGFALAALRVILRRIGPLPLWMCVLAALTLMCASVMPYAMRFSIVYYEAVAGTYCFAMAGIYFAVSALVDHRASLTRLALMSLCFGLAAASRPTLGLAALLLVPVYLSLRSTRPRRSLLVALITPMATCIALLGAYDQARFGNPFEYGTKYQINGVSSFNAHFGEIAYLLPGLWSYVITPLRLTALFPFLTINYPQVSYPLSLPAHYAPLSEETGGLFMMAPIVIFLAALPWMWRRRPAWLGSLAPFLLAMAAVGIACMVFLAYEIYTTSERYESDYMTLLVFGGLAVWLALSRQLHGRGRRLARASGAVLALWSCLAGLAISYQEIETHASTWRTLVNLGAPLSTAIAALAGHPVLADVYSPSAERSPPSYGNIGSEVNGFSLTATNRADVTIVSPNARNDALLANTTPGPALAAGAPIEVRVEGPGHARQVLRQPGAGGLARIPVHLSRGINRLTLTYATPGAATQPSASGAEGQPLVVFANFTLASG